MYDEVIVCFVLPKVLSQGRPLAGRWWGKTIKYQLGAEEGS
jgi:hypothetical protein